MTKKKKNELVDLSILELQEKSKSLGHEIFELRNQLAMQRRLEKPHMLRVARKEKARVLTLLAQKQREGATV